MGIWTEFDRITGNPLSIFGDDPSLAWQMDCVVMKENGDFSKKGYYDDYGQIIVGDQEYNVYSQSESPEYLPFTIYTAKCIEAHPQYKIYKSKLFHIIKNLNFPSGMKYSQEVLIDDIKKADKWKYKNPEETPENRDRIEKYVNHVFSLVSTEVPNKNINKNINKNMEKVIGDDKVLLELWNSKEIQKALKKAIKDSGKPVKKPRALSAYNFFCKQENPRLKEAHPKLKSTEIMRLLGESWKTLKNSTDKNDKNRLKEIEALVVADKQRVVEERAQMASEESDTDKKPRKQRATTAYMCFCKDERLKLEVKGKDAMKELGRRWRELSSSEKCKDKKRVEGYKTMAAEDKERVVAENKKLE